MTTQPITRTPDLIVARIRALEADGSDPHGIERSRLLEALPHDLAQPWFREGEVPSVELWEQSRIKTRDQAVERIRGQLPQAWRWANARRHQSVAKILAHFRGCYWLLGDESTVEALEFRPGTGMEGSLQYYGKRELVAASNGVGLDWRQLDDGAWVEVADAGPFVTLTADEVLGS